MRYADFLALKRRSAEPVGPDCSAADVHPFLHQWQAEGVAWAVRQGRAAFFWDCGLGKTVAQIEWARLSGRCALIVTPLAVAGQTIREAEKVGVSARYVRQGDAVTGPGVWVTNYEMVDRFDPRRFDAVVLDESSILKSFDGKTRTMLIEHFRPVPARLACTATPAPNDISELTNHAEFLGVACVRLWSNRGELVFSPFAGIGSEGVEAVRWGRRFLGIELKPSYWRTAVANLNAAANQQALFA